MDVDPGYKHFEFFCGGFQWYMMQSMDVISSTSFNIKNENDDSYYSTVNQYHLHYLSKKFNWTYTYNYMSVSYNCKR